MLELEPVKPFLGSETATKIDRPGAYLLGICYDGTTSFRPGTRFGPDAIRDASYGQESYSPYLNSDIEDISLFDLGNLPQYTSRFDKIQESFHTLLKDVDLKKQAIKLITLGGEHSLSSIPAKLYMEQFDDLVIIQLDAHADMRDQYLDDPYSHASVMKRIYDAKNEKQKIIQYGIRSGTREEFDFMNKNKTLIKSKNELLETLAALDNQRPIYMTIDLDFFDPAYLPGTGTPEAGGATFHDYIEILKVLKSKNLVGADVVELSPPIDSTGNSNSFASKVLRELLLV